MQKLITFDCTNIGDIQELCIILAGLHDRYGRLCGRFIRFKEANEHEELKKVEAESTKIVRMLSTLGNFDERWMKEFIENEERLCRLEDTILKEAIEDIRAKRTQP